MLYLIYHCIFYSDERHARLMKKPKTDDDDEEDEDLNDTNYDEVCIIKIFSAIVHCHVVCWIWR